MTLLYPIYFALAIPLVASLFFWRPPTPWIMGLRALTYALLLLAMVEIALRRPRDAGTLVVVADRSLSMPSDSETRHKEVLDILQSVQRGDDQLAVVSFGQSAAVEQTAQVGRFPGFTRHVERDGSNLAEAIERALSLIPRDSSGRVLLLTDGRWTGRDPLGLAAMAASRQIPLDYRVLTRPIGNDLAVARIEVPTTVRPGESFLLNAWLQSPVATEIDYELRRDGVVIAQGKKMPIAAGDSRWSFREQALAPGAGDYLLSVRGASADPIPENNQARFLIGVEGHRPLLVVSPTGAKSGLARLLREGQVAIEARAADEVSWSLADLAKYSAVLLENVPVEKIGQRGMENLASWVRDGGAGLMMTGGRDSYGVGGYYQSTLDPLLPVSMELRQEHRKNLLAIVVALDRSGSMMAPVGGNKVKMDLANLATAAVLDLLGTRDEFGVIAVDSSPHVVLPLQAVDAARGKRSTILKIASEGGGIFVYEALAAATNMVRSSKAGSRHIVLFADAADSEEPGNYKTLLSAARAADITVSVIGLGSARDTDADLLRDIAKRGGGRIFFTEKPEELPRLFAQDTFVVARNTFQDTPTSFQFTAGLTALTDRTLPAPPPLGGYNLCYIRPEANLAAVTLDEYRAPVVASWQAGAGRVLTYLGEADGQYAGQVAQWGKVGDFHSSLARWTVGQPGKLPHGMLLTHEVKQGGLAIHLFVDPDHVPPELKNAPVVTMLRERGEKSETRRLAMNWVAADQLTLETTLAGDETVLPTMTLAGRETVSLAPVCLPYSPEFAPVPKNQDTLERMARITGGKERLGLTDVWRDLPRQVRYTSLSRWFLFAVLLVFLLEICERRSGLLSYWTLAFIRWSRLHRWVWRGGKATVAVPPGRSAPTARAGFPRTPAAPVPSAKPEKTPTPAKPDAVPTKTPEPAKLPEPSLLDALRQARRRAEDQNRRDEK